MLFCLGSWDLHFFVHWEQVFCSQQACALLPDLVSRAVDVPFVIRPGEHLLTKGLSAGGHLYNCSQSAPILFQPGVDQEPHELPGWDFLALHVHQGKVRSPDAVYLRNPVGSHFLAPSLAYGKEPQKEARKGQRLSSVELQAKCILSFQSSWVSRNMLGTIGSELVLFTGNLSPTFLGEVRK